MGKAVACAATRRGRSFSDSKSFIVNDLEDKETRSGSEVRRLLRFNGLDNRPGKRKASLHICSSPSTALEARDTDGASYTP